MQINTIFLIQGISIPTHCLFSLNFVTIAKLKIGHIKYA